jgi:hypothetical protein
VWPGVSPAGEDEVGHQLLSLFNAHYDEHCFMPVHVYDADTGQIVARRRPARSLAIVVAITLVGTMYRP